MQLFMFVLMAFASLLTVALGNTLTFWPHDNVPRVIIFYPNRIPGKPWFYEQIPDIHMSGPPKDYTTGIPQGWQGMFKAIKEGEPRNKNNVIQGEVTFQGFEGKTYFDVSAIHNCCQNDGIRYIKPRHASKPESGCPGGFPCPNAYTSPHQLQTKVTTARDLICGVGRI